MSSFKLSIQCDNEAFDNGKLARGRGEEVVRILLATAEKIEQGQIEGETRDYNGNTVGKWGFTR